MPCDDLNNMNAINALKVSTVRPRGQFQRAVAVAFHFLLGPLSYALLVAVLANLPIPRLSMALLPLVLIIPAAKAMQSRAMAYASLLFACLLVCVLVSHADLNFYEGFARMNLGP